MTFSFIVIGRSEADCEIALGALKELRSEAFEVLLSTGHNPSEQRNEAAKKARGDYLVFLDNDSRVDSRLLHYYQDAIAYERGIDIVGGPSIYEGRGSYLKLCFQSVFASVFGLGPFRARYSSIGPVRRSSEHELILCNLMIRRDFFLNEGGFKQNLYPNEENEFLNRVRSRTKAYYHPLAICYRDPRESFRSFAKQVFGYGRGRAKHTVLFPTIWNQIFVVPAAFTLYSIALLLGLFLNLGTASETALYAPLAAYVLFSISASAFGAIGTRKPSMVFVLPWLFFSCHFLYGLGFLVGLAVYPFLKRERPSGEVRVVTAFDAMKLPARAVALA